MSVIATAVRHLMAAGMTGEALIDAIADIEAELAEQHLAKERAVDAAEEARREAKRANNAERQRRFRERHADHSNASNALQRVTDVTGVTDPSLSRPPNENISNPPTDTHPEPSPAPAPTRARADDFPRLDCASPELWQDFLRNRKLKRLPNTAAAHRRLVRDLDAMVARTGWPPGRVFEACVEQGWGAIYETDAMKGEVNERQTGFDRGQQRPQFARQSTSDIGREVARRLEAETNCHGSGRTFDDLPRIGSAGGFR